MTDRIENRDGLDEFEFIELARQKLTAKEVKGFAPGASYEQVKSSLAHLNRCRHFMSGTYHVAVDHETEHGMGAMPEGGHIAHLSIKRHDKLPMQDWRVMQRIKSAIVGAETEALELYPAETRVVDTANQYHLYAFVGCGTIPIGFPTGARSDNTAVNAQGGKSKQRPGSGGSNANHWTDANETQIP